MRWNSSYFGSCSVIIGRVTRVFNHWQDVLTLMINRDVEAASK